MKADAGTPFLPLLAVLAALGLAVALFAFLVWPVYAKEGSAPAKPTGLYATASHDQVTLTWDDPNDDSITGYVILRRHRHDDPNGHFDQLAPDTRTAASTYTDDTVEANIHYTYRIKAINAYGMSEHSRWFHIDTPAAPEPEETDPADLAPSNLTAELTDGQVVLGWDAPVEDAGPVTGYEVLRGQGVADPATLAADTGSATTAYTDPTAATASESYVYSVKAVRDGERSQASNEAVVHLPPARPTELHSAATHESVLLNWNVPHDYTITGYRILRTDTVDGEAGEFVAIASDTGSTDTSYTDTTVEPERSYAYRVHAINLQGVSGPSPDLQVDTPATPDPADLAPSNLAAELADGQASLNWDAPAEDAGSVTGYKVLRARGEDELTTLAADTGNTAMTYTDETADAPGESYAYRVKALRDQEKSQASNEAAIQLPDPPSSAPGGLTAQYGGGRVVLAWNAPAEDAASVTGYKILRAKGDAERTTLVADTGNAATTYADATATQASAVYAYRVRAIRDGDRSQDSNEARVQLPPAAPQGVLSAAAHDSVVLIWIGPQDGTITGYRILRQEPAADDPGEFVVLIEDTGSVTTTYTDADVAPSTSYTYRVQAINSQGAGEPSRDVPVETPAVPEPLRTLPAGTKQLEGTSDEATVSEPEDGDFPTSPITEGYIAIGESATGSIGQSRDSDAFRVELESGVTYQIDMKGDATADGTLTNPYLPGLKDADWENIPGTSNDNANDMLNSQVLFTPTESGSYYIVVRSATEDRGPDATGTYTVSIKLEGAAEAEQKDLLAADSSTILLLGLGDEVTQTIDYFADEDWIKVLLTAGTSYAITVTGGLEDDSLTLEIPWLFGLFDSESQPLLMYTGDRLGLAWTQIEGVDGVAVGYHKAENDGTYYVSVSSHSDVGTYRVIVQEVPESAYHGYGRPPHGTGVHYHAINKPVGVRNFFAWCPKDMEQGTVDSIPVAGGTHMTSWIGSGSFRGSFAVMPPDGHLVRLNTLARCVSVGDPSSNDNRRWYRLFDHSSASNDVPDLGALSDANPEITRHDYLRMTGEQDWTRFSVSQAGTFCVSVNKPAVSVKWNNGGDAQSIPGTARVYRERVSKRGMSLDFANDPESAKAAWLANSEIVRVELPSDSSPRAFYSDGTDLPLEDTWYLYDGTIDGDDYSGFVGDKRNVVSYGRRHAKPMADRKFQSQRYVQIDGAAPRDYFARVVHGGTGFSGTDGYILTISLGKCLAHSTMENSRSDTPPPKNLRAVQEKGAVELAWDAPDDAEVTGYRIERRHAGEDRNDPQRSHGRPRDNHVLVEDTGSADTSYTDQSAEQGVEYEYRVSARNEAGAGEGSDWVRAGPEPVFGDGPPGAPRNLTVTAGDQELTLSWEPPADNGNAPATRYRIEWRMDGKDYKKGHWGTSGSTTYTKTDLANGVKYVFRVKAENGSGNSYSYGPYGPASEEVSATPTSGSAVDLGTPVLSNTKTLHHGMVQLDWEDIEDAGWYVVQYYHVKSGEWLDLPAAGVDIAFHGSGAVVSNLHGLSWLRVRAVSCAGESEWSQIEELYGTRASDWEGVPVPDVAEGDQIEPCPVILGTPVLSNTKTLHHGMVRLDWEDIEDAGWYVVQYYHVKSGEWLDLPAAGVDIAFHGSGAVVSNLHGLSWLRVRAMSCAGESEWSQIEELYGTNASDWEGVPVPEVAEGDEIEPCSEEVATPDNSPATGAPAIGGTAQVGETLTADTSGVADADGLTNATFSYQWLADDSDISGATNATYTLVAEDEGKAIKVQVSFTDDADNEETLTSAATGAVDARPNSPATGAPTINGTAQVGEALTADTSGIADADGLSNVQYEYQWLADDAEIAGATGSTHTLADTDEGKAIKVEVSFTDDAGNDESMTSSATDAVAAPTPNTPATGAPTITGTVQVGETLTADTSGVADADGLGNVQYEYQWLADDADISGATNATYTLADTDEGKAIKVRVSFADDAGNGETLTSAATDAVSAAPTTNTPATGAPTISGTAQVGETLTANTSGVIDADGLSNVQYEYQWLADDAEVVGATGSTYTLADVDEGKAIKVEVNFTDDAGNDESLTSAATDAVAAEPSEPPAKPTGLSATATHDSVTLTWDDPGDDSITGYVILRRVRENDTGGEFSELVPDTGSAATSYTDATVVAETTYTYRIKAINGAGTSERSRWFHIDIPAAPVPDKPTGLSATATHDQVVLTWDDPGDDSITGYVILRRLRYDDPKGHFDELVADTGTADTTYTDDTVAAGTSYTYRIKAINGAGPGERSRWFHIDTPAAP